MTGPSPPGASCRRPRLDRAGRLIEHQILVRDLRAAERSAEKYQEQSDDIVWPLMGRG